MVNDKIDILCVLILCWVRARIYLVNCCSLGQTRELADFKLDNSSFPNKSSVMWPLVACSQSQYGQTGENTVL